MAPPPPPQHSSVIILCHFIFHTNNPFTCMCFPFIYLSLNVFLHLISLIQSQNHILDIILAHDHNGYNFGKKSFKVIQHISVGLKCRENIWIAVIFRKCHSIIYKVEIVRKILHPEWSMTYYILEKVCMSQYSAAEKNTNVNKHI